MYLLSEQQAESAGFKLLDLTASGGTATVYKARHEATAQTVALKVINPGGNPLCIEREARVLNTLNHPNIATFVAAGEIGSKVFLATQWVEGTSLRQWLDLDSNSEQRLLETNLALSLNKSLTDALAFAHSNGIVHGDINPNNILISNNREVKIVDFGIGRAAFDQTITVANELAGTPRYLAPELIHGDLPSPDSDQYALAIVIYELLTGQWPFSELQATAATALHHQLYTQATPIRELRPDFSPSMDLVFGKALNKIPSQRFKNVQTFHAALIQAAYPDSIDCNKHCSTTVKHTPGIALAVVLAICIVISIWWTQEESTTPLLASISTIDNDEQAQGSATKLDMTHKDSYCNLYVNAEFDNALEDNFYQDALFTDLAIRVDHPEATSSPILQIGDINQYGNYGIILDITGGQQYSFSAHLMFSGYVHKAELTIFWLDESWQTIYGEEDKLTIERRFDGTFQLSNVIAPDIAHYAVPTIFKDASAGIVYADNVAFLSIGQPCSL
ncbi:MAG: serine/threonine protein kinase [Granulosicoccus sp.]